MHVGLLLADGSCQIGAVIRADLSHDLFKPAEVGGYSTRRQV